MNRWFTSDNHFGHTNILKKFCPTTRQGHDANEMDEIMIKRWNGDVKPEDLVYCHGDFSFRDARKTANILRRLNGNKILIEGNHEKYLYEENPEEIDVEQLYTAIYSSWFGKIDGYKIHMFHYPIAQWRDMHKGSFHTYGHVHGGYQLPGRAMDVGIDTRPNKDMSLWSWEEVRDLLKDREIIPHHGD